MQTSLTYTEPILGVELTFSLIPRTELILSPYQRDLSGPLVNKLLNSVGKGFILPIVVVQTPEGYEIVDGQHRMAAVDKTLAKDSDLIPCLIIPESYKDFPLFYNIEQSDNIKDKATKLWHLYKDKATLFPEQTERQLSACANYEPFLFTIAFAFCENGLKSPSLVESVIRKLDNKELDEFQDDGTFLALPLEDSIELRREHALRAKALEDKVNDIAQMYGFTDYNLKKSIISTSTRTLWGMKRNLGLEFNDGMDMLFTQIDESDWSWLSGRRS